MNYRGYHVRRFKPKRTCNLIFYKKEIERKGYPPTVREICQGVGIKSTSTVYYALEKLENKSYIRKDPSKTRAIEIIDQNDGILTSKKDYRYSYIRQSYSRYSNLSC